MQGVLTSFNFFIPQFYIIFLLLKCEMSTQPDVCMQLLVSHKLCELINNCSISETLTKRREENQDG